MALPPSSSLSVDPEAQTLFTTRTRNLIAQRNRLQLQLIRAKLQAVKDTESDAHVLDLSNFVYNLSSKRRVNGSTYAPNGIVTAHDYPSTVAAVYFERELNSLISSNATLTARAPNHCVSLALATAHAQLASTSSPRASLVTPLLSIPRPLSPPMQVERQNPHVICHSRFQTRTYYAGHNRQKERHAPQAPWLPPPRRQAPHHPSDEPRGGYGYTGYRVPERVHSNFDHMNHHALCPMDEPRANLISTRRANASNFGFQKQTNYPFRLTYTTPSTQVSTVSRGRFFDVAQTDNHPFVLPPPPRIPNQPTFIVGKDGHLVPENNNR